MDSDISYLKFKILFINIFSILLKAATLNFYKLESELKELRSLQTQNSSSDDLPEFLIFLISLLLMAKFLFGYVGLAANVIAMLEQSNKTFAITQEPLLNYLSFCFLSFPILSDEQPDLLLPTILSQAIENILLSSIEILLGYITWKYYIPGKVSIFVIFLVRMVFKITLSLSTLNIYSDLYSQLKFPSAPKASNIQDGSNTQIEANEQFVQKQSLAV